MTHLSTRGGGTSTTPSACGVGVATTVGAATCDGGAAGSAAMEATTGVAAVTTAGGLAGPVGAVVGAAGTGPSTCCTVVSVPRPSPRSRDYCA